MKNLFIFLTLLFLTSCGDSAETPSQDSKKKTITSSSENSATLDNVIVQFCEASNQKDEKKMTNLVYPGLFTEQLNKEAIQYMFQRQLQATERFLVTEIKEELNPELVYTFKDDKFYIQTYSSNVDIKISQNSSVAFEDLVTQMVKSDPEAKVNAEDRSIQFAEKRKILLVNNNSGTYVLPEIFIDFLTVEGLDKAKLKDSF